MTNASDDLRDTAPAHQVESVAPGCSDAPISMHHASCTDATRSDVPDRAGAIISIAAAADALGLNKSTLSRQVKAGLIRSYPRGVILAEVIEDRASRIDWSKSHRRSAKTATPAATSDATYSVG